MLSTQLDERRACVPGKKKQGTVYISTSMTVNTRQGTSLRGRGGSSRVTGSGMRSGSRGSLYFFAFAAASTTGAKDCMLVLASPSEYATHRSMDDPGPLSPSIAPDGRIAVVCPKSRSPRSICISGSLWSRQQGAMIS